MRYITLVSLVLFALVASSFTQDIKKDLKKGWQAWSGLDGATTKKYFELVVANPNLETLSAYEKLELFRQLGWLYFTDAEFDKAVPTLLRAIAIREESVGKPVIPKSQTALFNVDGQFTDEDLYFLGSAEMKLGRYSDAELHLQKALELSDGTARWDRFRNRQALGILYYRTKQYDLAVPYLTAFIDSTGDHVHYQNSEALSILADIYREQGKYAEAESLYKRAIEMMEWYDTHASPHVKAFDDVRIFNFNGYARLLHVLKRDREAVAFEDKAKAIQSTYK